MVQKPSQEAKQTLAARAHQVAVSVQEIVHCSELIKDNTNTVFVNVFLITVIQPYLQAPRRRWSPLLLESRM